MVGFGHQGKSFHSLGFTIYQVGNQDLQDYPNLV